MKKIKSRNSLSSVGKRNHSFPICQNPYGVNMEKLKYTPNDTTITHDLDITTGEVFYDGESVGLYQHYKLMVSSCFCLQLFAERLVYFQNEEEMSLYIIERMS